MKIQKKIIIQNHQGLHARPATIFVQAAKKFKSKILVSNGKDEVDGKSIIGILMLGADRGSKVILKAEGEDAEDAILKLEAVLISDKKVSLPR
ncbi:hypothetical protein B9J78_05370 [bacterium Unc6]|nr:hypothetical protein [bacterium Unc6]